MTNNMNFDDGDLKEIKDCVRFRADALEKESEWLTKLSRPDEAQRLSATATDLKERICTQLAAQIGG